MAILLTIFQIVSDFDIGKNNYKKGNYQIAKVIFEEVIKEYPNDRMIPEALYYLIKIYEREDDFINFLSYTNEYLKLHKFEIRREEVFNLLLKKLIEKGCYTLALDYIKYYNFLVPDSLMLLKIGMELIKKPQFASDILWLLPDNDSIKILYGQALAEPSTRETVYKSLKGVKGKIYLIENYLFMGDTIKAYLTFREIKKEGFPNELLYRFTKIDQLFSKGIYRDSIRQLDSVPTAPPKGINLDSLFSDTIDIIYRIEKIRDSIRDNYYLDSVYVQILMIRNNISTAYNVIKKYLNYCNTINFARRIRAIKYFDEHQYRAAANDIILIVCEAPETKFLLAECLRKLGEIPTYLYLEVMKLTKDSVLYFNSFKNYVEFEYTNRNYVNIVKYDFKNFQGDTNLIKIYLNSLARVGKKAKADSIYSVTFANLDFNYLNYFGEYLFEKKLLNEAESYYDSITKLSNRAMPDKIYYNWALIPFLKGDFNLAEERFEYYIENFENSQNYSSALFKMATIKYMKMDFDSAAYYYGLAGRDSLLYQDALRNQLIAYKKVEAWKDVIDVGNRMLKNCLDDEKPEINFEIGYAYLRMANIRRCIEYLENTTRLKSSPEYHYWLGEAYLGKGEFLKALYQYQKIINNLPKDEMWYPTAQFKTGLVLELMNEFEEAKKIYTAIVKKRGSDDVWGAEAQKRLKTLE